MSLPDPSRAYHAGVITVSLNQASQALVAALGSARSLDYDADLTEKINAALLLVMKASHIKVSWNPLLASDNNQHEENQSS